MRAMRLWPEDRAPWPIGAITSTSTDVIPIHRSQIKQWGDNCCVDDWPSELSCFPVFQRGSRVAGRLGIMGSGGSSQARIFHGKPSHQTGNCFVFIFLLQLLRRGLCFVSQSHSRLWVDSFLRFHWLKSCFNLQIFTSAWGFDMLNFAHGVTLGVCLRRWHDDMVVLQVAAGGPSGNRKMSRS